MELVKLLEATMVVYVKNKFKKELSGESLSTRTIYPPFLTNHLSLLPQPAV
jgi:hypothetical protein